MTTFIGDVHGKFEHYMYLIGKHPSTIQVGDFGLGFIPHYDLAMTQIMQDKPNHKFIRGNHDNPEVCKSLIKRPSDK